MREAPDWILVGQVKRIHGGGGELLIKALTDHVEERFHAGGVLYLSLKRQDVRAKVKIASSRMTGRGPLIRLEGFNTREEVWDLFGASLFIRSSELAEPEPDQYYEFQLLGCEVFDGERRVGVVSRLYESPKANPYLEVDPGGEEKHIFIPFVSQVVVSVDLERQRIDVVEGFLD